MPNGSRYILKKRENARFAYLYTTLSFALHVFREGNAYIHESNAFIHAKVSRYSSICKSFELFCRSFALFRKNYAFFSRHFRVNLLYYGKNIIFSPAKISPRGFNSNINLSFCEILGPICCACLHLQFLSTRSFSLY